MLMSISDMWLCQLFALNLSPDHGDFQQQLVSPTMKTKGTLY